MAVTQGSRDTDKRQKLGDLRDIANEVGERIFVMFFAGA